MYYFEILVSVDKFWQNSILTYSSENELKLKSVVVVPFGNKQKLGIVLRSTSRPNFETKNIIDTAIIPNNLRLLDSINKHYERPPEYFLGLFNRCFLIDQKINPPPSSRIKNIELNDQQKSACDLISNNKNLSSLLLGQTGSGKTHVFLELAARCIQNNEQILLLSPEIKLLNSLSSRIKKYFDNINIFDSSQTLKTRKSFVNAAYQGIPGVFCGTRSSIFTEFKHLKYIFVDEFHDDSYYQYEGGPKYDSKVVLAYKALTSNVQIIYSSATPPVVDYYISEQKKYDIIKLNTLNTDPNRIKISIIDTKDKSKFNKSKHFSDHVLTQIQSNIDHKLQTIIYLNKRGNARYASCNNCDFVSECTDCDKPLVLHRDLNELRCSICGKKQKPLSICPKCKQGEIVYTSPGIKEIENNIRKLFPEASIIRLDSDSRSFKAKDIESLQDDKYQIIIGTQIISKGLDLPNLNTIIIQNMDSNIQIPDFSNTEKVYQNLKQTIGRVGRIHRNGNAYIQTINPNHKIIKLLTSNNYLDFYNEELAERKLSGYPPFNYLLIVKYSHKSEIKSQEYLDKVKKIISNAHIKISGPAPAFFHKSRGKFNWQLVVKAKRHTYLQEAIRKLPKDVDYLLNPNSIM